MARKNFIGWACKTKGGNWVRFYGGQILFPRRPAFVKKGDTRWVKVRLLEVFNDTSGK